MQIFHTSSYMCTQFVTYNIKIHGKYTKQNVYEFEVTKLSCKSIMLCMPWYECVLAKSFFESYVNWSAWGDNIKTSHTIQQYNIKCYVKKTFKFIWFLFENSNTEYSRIFPYLFRMELFERNLGTTNTNKLFT